MLTERRPERADSGASRGGVEPGDGRTETGAPGGALLDELVAA
jgi:hypothetical protein